MEKKLNKMKSEIATRCNRIAGLIACTAGLLTLSISDIFVIDLGAENANQFVAGFQLGILCVLLLAFVSKLVAFRKALKDEKLLKQMYYKENDERVTFINQQVGKSSMTVTTVLLLIGAIIAGYFNQLLLFWYHTNHVTCEEE